MPPRRSSPTSIPETRSATALARRLQDPLLELCRAEARSLAEGPYVHEVSQRLLNRRLEQTVESCLHDVGVDVNRAGAAVLARVAGLGAEGAKSLLELRRSGGPFVSRAALRPALSDEKRSSSARVSSSCARLRAPPRRRRASIPSVMPPSRPARRGTPRPRRTSLEKGRPSCARTRASTSEIGPRTLADVSRGARGPRPRSPRSLRSVPLPRRRAAPRGPQARDGVPWPRDEHHELRRVRRPRRAPGRTRACLAASRARRRRRPERRGSRATGSRFAW